ncbi:MAG: hypothetical protein QGG40_05890, partial [Myxococcota bacterium]|nr:hypothetical protein [Myxococcota bacterium]
WSDSSVSSDPDYECNDENPQPSTDDDEVVISEEYLDCLCGFDDWDGNSGGGTEEHLEATLMALCRSVEEPPEVCYDDLSPFDEDQVLSNDGMLREGSTAVVVIVTDEGDTSRRLAQGEEDPSLYLDAFDDFDIPIRFAVIGPETEECNTGSATTWGTERLQTTASETDGMYAEIAELDENGECAVADFSVHLENLGALLNNLLYSFRLDGVPDQSTIRVYVDQQEVTRSDGDEQVWWYEPSDNSVTFNPAYVPDYHQEVRIYYRPLEGNPRDLPF